MLNREQRRKNNQNSLIPPTNRHITTDATVTPTKLDVNKNNNKSRLFSTTCSRRAQEEKNYNKRPIINNKNLSSFYLPKQKMNTKTTTNTTKTNNNNTTTFRKSPLTQLKQDLERLRQQKLEDESLIQRQTQDILELKKKLIKTKELELQLLKKATIETKSSLVNIEIKKLSTDVIDLLHVTKSSDQIINNREIMVEKLQTQLEKQEADFKKKLEKYTILTIEINQNIQSNQELFNKLKVEHAIEISQLNIIHKDQLSRLKFDHKQELIKLKKKKQCTTNNFEHILEQALIEFEQEQHNHIPSIIQHDLNYKSLHGKIIPTMKNQQWYSKKYLPIDAKSWPAPQLSPNLKKFNHHSR